MSRIGKLPISIPSGVEVILSQLNGLNLVSIKGPKGSLEKSFAGNINLVKESDFIKVVPLDQKKFTLSMWGTARSILNNMVIGVTNTFVKDLEISGVGYKASKSGPYLNLSVGKSHSVKILIPNSISIEISKKEDLVTLCSADKETLGQFISKIIKECPVEPYKGKGIRIKGSYFAKKEVVKSKKK